MARSFSLPDWLFFPIAGLLVAALVYLAMQIRPAGASAEVSDTRFQLEGAALSTFIPGPGTRVSFTPEAAGGAAARMTANASMETSGRLSAGVGAVVPPEFEARVIGRTIRVEVEMRSLNDTLTSAHIGYFTVGGGDSGWREVEIGPDYQVTSFQHEIPAREQPNDQEWVGIWPDEEGRARSLLVRRITVIILDEDASQTPG
ncbi:MAG: hypothetical protein AAFX09_12035 [Pseudomonadota bacterium]